MPFARLSIKSAIKMAQASVSLQHQGNDAWLVCVRYANEIHTKSGPYPRLEAKASRRKWRVFIALRVLGIGTVTAANMAEKAKYSEGDWRTVVALSLAKSLTKRTG